MATTGDSILGTHAGDFLSSSVSEALTVGNKGLASTIRIYDCNAPLNGYFITTSNGIFTINDANPSIPTNVGIGTTAPLPTATLQVQGTLLTSNIGTYTTNTNNTLYFNNTNLSGINSITVQNALNTSGNSTISGTLNAQNIICGSNSSVLTVTANTLSVDMNNKSYSVFTCSTTTNIQTLTVTNDISGAQAIVYITTNAAGGITISGNNVPLGGTNVKSSYTTVSLANNGYAIMAITSDGTRRFVNCISYT